MRDLFAQIDQRSVTHHIESTVSYLEVYNENIRDLLAPSSPANASSHLDLREDDTQSRVVVSHLSEHRPKHVNDVMNMLLRGNENRTKAPTEANAVSSRSHAVLQICVKVREKTASSSIEWKIATLSIIDLAGSERASVTKNKGERLLEGANINRSLLALGNCINALCSDKPNHVPYRDSKLTRLLKYSLSGSCKVVMIANISPSSIHYDETHNTLKYANRAKNISTKIVQNSVNVDIHLAQYPKVIEELRAEVHELRRQLAENGAEGPQSQSSTGKLPDTTEADFAAAREIVDRLKRLLEKVDAKQLDYVNASLQIDRNERRLSLMRTLHAALLDVSAVSDANELAAAMEALYASNTALRHNADQAEVAMKRHMVTVERLREGKGIRDTVVRERLQADCAGLVTLSLVTRESKAAELWRRVGKEVREEMEGMAGRLGRIVVALHAGMQFAGASDGAAAAAKMEEAFGDAVLVLMELSGRGGNVVDVPEVDVGYDSVSEDESSWGDEVNEMEQSDRSKGTSATNLTPEREPPASTPPTPPTAIKVQSPVDDDATPTADRISRRNNAKRGSDDNLEDQPTTKRLRSTRTDNSRTTANTPDDLSTISKPRTNPSNDSDLTAQLSRPIPDLSSTLPATIVFHDADNTDNLRDSQAGPVRASPARRAKRREARQSLIPVMRSRRDSVAPAGELDIATPFGSSIPATPSKLRNGSTAKGKKGGVDGEGGGRMTPRTTKSRKVAGMESAMKSGRSGRGRVKDLVSDLEELAKENGEKGSRDAGVTASFGSAGSVGVGLRSEGVQTRSARRRLVDG
ncbi:kinesin-like protein Klp5 [Rhizophlyctis rosea]|uniref:Kinesin-like protein n=1 Tax=Rhizophlyctis rosea TaxID=64517 RepID=A0AAD5SKC3_9FUNG|nr:kinesin-like protein Klp5 [Rhizophlyctis rosea]